jgi:hypothetical protein
MANGAHGKLFSAYVAFSLLRKLLEETLQKSQMIPDFEVATNLATMTAAACCSMQASLRAMAGARS